jgi:hypothetical protein
MAGESGTRAYHVTPYLWASGLNGEVGVLDRTVDVDLGFVDIVENLDGAAMLVLGASRGRWGGAFEIIYMKLSNQGATPGPLFTSAELEAKQLLLELTGRYALVSSESTTVDVLAGGRYWRLDNSLELTEGALPAISVSDTKTWFDPIIGIEADWNVGSRWLTRARGDVGGFDVGSELSWQLLGLAGYRLSDAWTVGAGYRHFDVDYTSDGFTYDVASSGFIAGVTYSFE